MKTSNLKKKEIVREWFIIDANNAIVGRLASRIASILRGKHKPLFTPHLDTGDFVVVINAEKLRFTGKKEEEKRYWHYTGFPGGERSITPMEQRKKNPERILFSAVSGMVSKGPLGRSILKKLKIYSGDKHPHVAQQPKITNLSFGGNE